MVGGRPKAKGRRPKFGSADRRPGVLILASAFGLRPLALHRRADRQLRADDRLYSGGLRGPVELRRAVDAITIEQRQRGIAKLRGAVDERAGQRGAIQK